jgi:hypothetical protein
MHTRKEMEYHSLLNATLHNHKPYFAEMKFAWQGTILQIKDNFTFLFFLPMSYQKNS